MPVRRGEGEKKAWSIWCWHLPNPVSALKSTGEEETAKESLNVRKEGITLDFQHLFTSVHLAECIEIWAVYPRGGKKIMGKGKNKTKKPGHSRSPWCDQGMQVEAFCSPKSLGQWVAMTEWPGSLKAWVDHSSCLSLSFPRPLIYSERIMFYSISPKSSFSPLVSHKSSHKKVFILLSFYFISFISEVGLEKAFTTSKVAGPSAARRAR